MELRDLDECSDMSTGEEGSVPLVRVNETKFNSLNDPDYKTYFCYRCEERFRIYHHTNNISCPDWDDDFVEEINSEDLEDSSEEHKSHSGRQRRTIQSLPSFISFDSSDADEDDMRIRRLMAFMIFSHRNRYRTNRGGGLHHVPIFDSPMGGNNRSPFHRFPSNEPGITFDDIFARMFERILRERGGSHDQQPANQSTIKGLKTIKITKKHYEEDAATGQMQPPSWAICTDSLEVKAKTLSCNHLFHKEWIVKWLKIHHICPVCRKEVD